MVRPVQLHRPGARVRQHQWRVDARRVGDMVKHGRRPRSLLRANAAGSPSGVTITIAASTGTYLEAAVSEYSGVAQTAALDKAVVGKGVGTAADSGATPAVGPGELVVGGVITGGSPGGTTAGATQGQMFTMRAQRPSGSVDIEDVLSRTAGAQNGRATLHNSTDWYAMGAVFHAYASADTQPPTVPTGLAAT